VVASVRSAQIHTVPVWVTEPFAASWLVSADLGAVLFVNTHHVVTAAHGVTVRRWADAQLAAGCPAALMDASRL
jgi:hypothetical protein